MPAAPADFPARAPRQSAARSAPALPLAPPADAGQAPAIAAAPLSATHEQFLKPLRAIVDALARPIPPRLISQKKVPTKKGGSYSADFVHHATICDLLDYHAPGWAWNVCLFDTAGKLYVVGTLTLVGTDGTQARDGIGNADDDLDGYGDPSSNAEAQALRRAAMAHGLGRALWRKT